MEQKTEKTIPVTTLLTHIHPDLDAVFSVYLMRRHGEQKFPGVETADFRFVSANILPDGKTPEELETEGILSLDTGGGRFDTHPREDDSNEEKWDTCASKLVAEYLGVDKEKRYRYLLPFSLAQDTAGKSLTSRDAAHHLLAPHSLLEGLHSYIDDDEKVMNLFLDFIDGLSNAGEEDEPELRELAEVFDRTFAAFLKEKYSPVSTIRRKTLDDWDAEGDSHRLAVDKDYAHYRELEKLLRTLSRMLAGVDKALPEQEEERRILLPQAIWSLSKKYGEDSEQFHHIAFELIFGAIQREADWYEALAEVKRSARVIRGRSCTVIAIASRNGLVIKAARYSKGADGVLYYEPKRHMVTVQAGYRNDGRPHVNLQRLAARLRTADSIKKNNFKPVKNAFKVGMHEGWFLHQSLQLLNRGSPKAPDVKPTNLSYDEIIEIVRSEIRPEYKLPDWLCPPDKCTENRCPFFNLQLANCRSHQQKVKTQPKKGTLGDLFADQLKDIKKKMK